MGVYIKGMEMPTSCSRCAMFDEGSNGDPDWCNVMHQVPEYGTCPLVPVPDHGDLIDRGTLFGKIFNEGYIAKVLTASKDELENAMVNMPLVINNLPAVIEADKGGDVK